MGNQYIAIAKQTQVRREYYLEIGRYLYKESTKRDERNSPLECRNCRKRGEQETVFVSSYS